MTNKNNYGSNIEWTDDTWNPWAGCTKISPGCKYCYMYRDQDRFKQHDPSIVRRTANDTFFKPLKIKDPTMIFTCSYSDFFIEAADMWRPDAWKIIKDTPQHTYQILTKRPENISSRLPDDWGNGYQNVWLGVSVENDQYIERIWQLQKIPAQIRFISAEPLIGDLTELDKALAYNKGIHWIIVGGESGFETGKYRYRPAQFKWFERIIELGKKYEVAIFVKQLGTHLAKSMNLKGKGNDVTQWPDWLRVREYPDWVENV